MARQRGEGGRFHSGQEGLENGVDAPRDLGRSVGYGSGRLLLNNAPTHNIESVNRAPASRMEQGTHLQMVSASSGSFRGTSTGQIIQTTSGQTIQLADGQVVQVVGTGQNGKVQFTQGNNNAHFVTLQEVPVSKDDARQNSDLLWSGAGNVPAYGLIWAVLSLIHLSHVDCISQPWSIHFAINIIFTRLSQLCKFSFLIWGNFNLYGYFFFGKVS